MRTVQQDKSRIMNKMHDQMREKQSKEAGMLKAQMLRVSVGLYKQITLISILNSLK